MIHRRRNDLPAFALRAAALAGLMLLPACGPSLAPAPLAATPDGWHEFEGTWTAAGQRRTLALGPERRVSIAELRGTLLLAGPSRPGLGFRGEALSLADSGKEMTGSAVWTDDRGDQVFSDLRGQGNATGNRITGTFTGGTGRYVGATGSYEFSWQYVLESEDGTVQGRAVGLKGRVRVGTGQGSRP